jgi:hypothetical protein
MTRSRRKELLFFIAMLLERRVRDTAVQWARCWIAAWVSPHPPFLPGPVPVVPHSQIPVAATPIAIGAHAIEYAGGIALTKSFTITYKSPTGLEEVLWWKSSIVSHSDRDVVVFDMDMCRVHPETMKKTVLVNVNAEFKILRSGNRSSNFYFPSAAERRVLSDMLRREDRCLEPSPEFDVVEESLNWPPLAESMVVHVQQQGFEEWDILVDVPNIHDHETKRHVGYAEGEYNYENGYAPKVRLRHFHHKENRSVASLILCSTLLPS